MLEKPFIKLFQSPNSGYFYDVGKNEIVRIPMNLYHHLVGVLDGNFSLGESKDDDIQEMLNSLKNLGYLSSKKPQKIQHSATSVAHLFLDRCIDKITLQLTQDCNFRCKYCIYSEENNFKQRSHSRKTMSLTTAKEAILFYRDHAVDSNMYNVGLYGGEPLLAWGTLREIILFAERELLGKPLSFSLTTNASLLTESIVDFLDEHNVNLMVSLDGIKEIHDKNRVFSDGHGSFDIVMQNLKMIKKRHPRLFERLRISSVVDPDICASAFGKYPELINDLPLNHYSISIEENTDHSLIIPQELYTELENETQLAFLAEHGLYSGINKPYGYNQMILIRNRMNSLKPAVGINDIMAPSGPCIPGKSRLFITYNGKFYPCERVNETDANCIGNLSQGFDTEKVKRILNIGSISADKCANCWALRLCTICIKGFDFESENAVIEKTNMCNSVQSTAYNFIRWVILSHEIQSDYKSIIKKGQRI